MAAAKKPASKQSTPGSSGRSQTQGAASGNALGGQNKATSASNYRSTSSQATRAAQPTIQAIARKTEKKVLEAGNLGVPRKTKDKIWAQGEKEVIAAYNAARKSAFSGKPAPKKK